MTQASTARNYSLDAARGILMMMGAFLHAANIYSVGGGWIVHDGDTSPYFDLLSRLIHAFRMPTFFWISGYFCAMTFQRSGRDGLLRKRLPRLIVPLVMAWATLNVAQDCILAWLRHQNVAMALLDGVPIYHLWFLVDLMVFIFLAAMILPAVKSLESFDLPPGAKNLPAMLSLLTLTAALTSWIVRSSGVAYDQIFHVTSLNRLGTYLPFFFFGIVMYKSAEMRQRFFQTPSILMIFALPILLSAQNYRDDTSLAIREMAFLVEIFMTWISVAVVLRIFHDVVKTESALTRLLSDSAYTVYLFHHIIVVTGGTLLIQLPLPVLTKFIIVCITSIGLSLLIHTMLIQRSRVARFLFNGK